MNDENNTDQGVIFFPKLFFFTGITFRKNDTENSVGLKLLKQFLYVMMKLPISFFDIRAYSVFL